LKASPLASITIETGPCCKSANHPVRAVVVLQALYPNSPEFAHPVYLVNVTKGALAEAEELHFPFFLVVPLVYG